MTLGEKIKKARLKAGLTQRALAGDKITRNMLSSIESGNANPSMDTLKYLADELKIPMEYLVSDDDELFFCEKKRKIGRRTVLNIICRVYVSNFCYIVNNIFSRICTFTIRLYQLYIFYIESLYNYIEKLCS